MHLWDNGVVTYSRPPEKATKFAADAAAISVVPPKRSGAKSIAAAGDIHKARETREARERSRGGGIGGAGKITANQVTFIR